MNINQTNKMPHHIESGNADILKFTTGARRD